MTTTEIKQHIYTLTPEDAKEVHSYTSDLIAERTHDAIREKNKQVISDYLNMVNYIEDSMFIKIISSSRKQEVAYARYCLYTYIKNELNDIESNSRSYSTIIANVFNKDHSSVIHGLNTYKDEIKVNKELQYIDTQIKAIIKEYKDKIYLTNIENQN